MAQFIATSTRCALGSNREFWNKNLWRIARVRQLAGRCVSESHLLVIKRKLIPRTRLGCMVSFQRFTSPSLSWSHGRVSSSCCCQGQVHQPCHERLVLPFFTLIQLLAWVVCGEIYIWLNTLCLTLPWIFPSPTPSHPIHHLFQSSKSASPWCEILTLPPPNKDRSTTAVAEQRLIALP